MDRPKPDTTLAFSFAEPSVALHALLGQGTTAKPQSKEPKESKTARIVPSMTYDSDSSNPAYIRRNDFLDENKKHRLSRLLHQNSHRAPAEAQDSTAKTSRQLKGDSSTPHDRDQSRQNQPRRDTDNRHMPNMFDRSAQPAAPGPTSEAAKLKRKFSAAMAHNPSSALKVSAEQDPENHEIKRLRERGLKWGDIANRLNKQRVAAGKLPSLTDSAVYSRYVRNAPRIAAAKSQAWDNKHAGPPSSKKGEQTAANVGFDETEDRRLVEAYTEIAGETWELVSERILAKGGKRHDPEVCARRYQAI